MPDWLHPTGQPSSEKGQDQMMQAKIPEIHIHKASRRNFIFFRWLTCPTLPISVPSMEAEKPGAAGSPEGSCALPLCQQTSTPFSSPTELLPSKTHCAKYPFPGAGSSLHTPKCFSVSFRAPVFL